MKRIQQLTALYSPVSSDTLDRNYVHCRCTKGEEHDSFCYYTMLAIMVLPPALAAAYKILTQVLRFSMYMCVGGVMLLAGLLLLPVLLPLSIPLAGLALLIKFLSYTHSSYTSQTGTDSAATSPRTKHRRKKRSLDYNSNGLHTHNGHANGEATAYDEEHVFLNGSGVIHTNASLRKSRH